MSTPQPIFPLAAALVASIDTELDRPAASMAPAGLRRLVRQLGALMLEVARRVDDLETGNKGAAT